MWKHVMRVLPACLDQSAVAVEVSDMRLRLSVTAPVVLMDPPSPPDSQIGAVTARSVLREGGATIASIDRLLGRSWDARRLQRWEGLVADSLFGPIGRARVRRHWDRALTRGNQPTNCGVGTVAGRELGSQVAR
jgi:hypothetical protein